MATTTNYGWETPDDTDLVKDGAAAIRTLGNSVDTTTKNLNPETTLGDLAYRSATSNVNTRLGIGSAGQVLTVASGVPTWATPTAGDIEGVTAGTGISGGGTSGTVTITNTMATAIDAKGDLIVGTGADAFSRLAVGATNGMVLTVDSAEATGLKYASPSSGALTKITSATFTSVTSVSFPANTFTSTYDDYQIIFIITNVTQNTTIKGRLRASGVDNTSDYFSQLAQAGTSATNTNVVAGDAFTFGSTIANGDYNHGIYTISEPKRSQKTRLFGGGVALDNTSNANINSTAGSHFHNTTTSFDSFTLFAASGNITGRYAVYGLEK